jgi:hypothetical protein
MQNVRCLRSVVCLLAVSLLGCQQSERSSVGYFVPGQLVAEAPIVTDGPDAAWPILTTMIQGHTIPLVLDLGSAGNALTRTMIEDSAITLTSGAVLDSLTLGTTIQHHVLVDLVDRKSADGAALGRLGTPVLSQYDWVIDGPAHRVRLYATQPDPPTVRSAWFPPGITWADCTPIQVDPDSGKRVLFSLRANGHAIHSMFDSGSGSTNINLAAAADMGLSLLSPNVQATNELYYIGENRVHWKATGVTLMVGTHYLTVPQINIFEHLPHETSPFDAELSLGLNALTDRLFFVSYSSGQVCFSQPIRVGI